MLTIATQQQIDSALVLAYEHIVTQIKKDYIHNLHNYFVAARLQGLIHNNTNKFMPYIE